MKPVPLKKLRRGLQEYRIHPELWANAILFASDHGWKPSFPTYFILGSGVDVSEEDAAGLVRAWDHLIDNAATYIARRKIVRQAGEVHVIEIELGGTGGDT